MLELALPLECPPLDLTRMTPAGSAHVYEFRDAEGNPRGARNRYEFEVLDDGAVLAHRVVERNGEVIPFISTTTFRFGFFGELPAFPERGIRWSYEYDSDAVQELESLEPGETVEIPATSVMSYDGGRNRVEDVHRVTHEGCSQAEVMGAPVQVHTLRFDAFNQFLNRSGEPQTRRSTIVREYAPTYGWWVAEVSSGHRSMVLVEVED